MNKIVCFKCHGKDFRKLSDKSDKKSEKISYTPTYKGK